MNEQRLRTFALHTGKDFIRLRRQKAEYRILIFGIDNKFTQEVKRGFIFALSGGGSREGLYNLRFYTKHSEQRDRAHELIDQIIKDEQPDLIYSVGVFSTAMIKTVTEQLDIPVVFSGTGAPEQYGFVKSLEHSGNNLIGVEIDMIPDLLYVQILINIYPECKSVLIPYYSRNSVSFLHAFALRVKSFLERNSIGVTLLPFSNRQEAVKDIKKSLLEYDVLMFLHKDLSLGSFYSEFGAYCNENKVMFVGDKQGAIENGAAFTITADVYPLGYHAGLLTKRIMEERLERLNWNSTQIIECPRKLIVNERVLTQLGINLTSELIAEIEQNLLVSSNVVHPFTAIYPQEVNMFVDVTTGICDSITKHHSDKSFYTPEFLEVAVDRDKELVKHDIIEYLQQRKDDVALVTYGRVVTKVVQELMQKREYKKRIPIISVLSERLEPDLVSRIKKLHAGGEQVSDTDTPTIYVCIQANPLTLPVDTLLQIKPNIKTILIPWIANGADFRVVQRKLESYGKKKKIKFIFKCGRSVHQFTDIFERYKAQVDAIYCIEDFTHMHTAHNLCRLASKNGVPIVGAGLESAKQGAALGYGVNNKLIGAHVFSCLRRILDDYQHPLDLPPIYVLEGYSVSVNEKALLLQGVELLPQMRLLLGRHSLIS